MADSTNEGQWELKGGKFVQKRVMTIDAGESNFVRVAVQCPNCQESARRISSLEESRKHLLEILNTERSSNIGPLRERLERLEIESQTWLSERGRLEQTIKERDRTIEELRALLGLRNETTTVTVQDRFLTGQGQQVAHDSRWYYAVQNQSHAQLFQMHPRYCGGDIVVDALEGATVVNPEYYTQSERVPGTARLRVRVVDAHGAALTSGTNIELFARLRIGSATQFTQPRAATNGTVAWQQDFVFVGVPLIPHANQPQYQKSEHPLTVEVVSRTIGLPQEQIIGSGTIDLSDLVLGLTRAVSLVLNNGNAINVRIKALDFGLPNSEISISQTVAPSPVFHHQTVQTVTKSVTTLPQQELEQRVLVAEMAEQLRNTTYPVTNYSQTTSKMSYGTTDVTNPVGVISGGNSYYNVSDPTIARKLDSSDGLVDGRFGNVPINIMGTPYAVDPSYGAYSSAPIRA